MLSQVYIKIKKQNKTPLLWVYNIQACGTPKVDARKTNKQKQKNKENMMEYKPSGWTDVFWIETIGVSKNSNI